LIYLRRALTDLSIKCARVRGKAKVADAVRIARNLRESDLVFVDPPYSGVHYSRFYHVLETLARGTCGPVSGTGRYPPPSERPKSLFSQKLGAPRAIEHLFRTLADRGCTVIVTFPAHQCSNGLSGTGVAQCAEQHFAIDRKVIKTRFSTLGGNGHNRSARQDSSEMMLVLRPR
jgi:adenine-specific DNA methylase